MNAFHRKMPMPAPVNRRRAVALMLGGLLLPATAQAAWRTKARYGSDVGDAPPLRDGDFWAYSHVWEQSHTVVRPQATEVTIAYQPERGWPHGVYMATRREMDTGKSDTWGVGQDWSRWHGTGRARQDDDRPLHFPLYPGKMWDVERWLPDPDTMGYEREGVHQHYVVTGWEDIKVPAGQFFAVKIEVSGKWQAIPPKGSIGQGPKDGQPRPHTLWDAPSPLYGQLYRAYWYAPEVKRWVKQIEVYYDANGAELERHTAVLERYKVSF